MLGGCSSSMGGLRRSGRGTPLQGGELGSPFPALGLCCLISQGRMLHSAIGNISEKPLGPGVCSWTIFKLRFFWKPMYLTGKLRVLKKKKIIYFFWPHLCHVEVPGLEVESELQLLAYTTAMPTLDPSHTCDLDHSLWQCRVLNPLIEPAFSWTLCWVLNLLSHNGNSRKLRFCLLPGNHGSHHEQRIWPTAGRICAQIWS